MQHSRQDSATELADNLTCVMYTTGLRDKITHLLSRGGSEARRWRRWVRPPGQHRRPRGQNTQTQPAGRVAKVDRGGRHTTEMLRYGLEKHTQRDELVAALTRADA